jgi:anaerobic selenocysteine-containing dehydrogenase
MAEATGYGQPAAPVRAEPEEWAGGTPAVTGALARATNRMGPVRAARTPLRLNQDHGVDCPSWAWPDPPAGHRSRAEFCENGAKAVAHEGTTRGVGAAFAAIHRLADLEGHDDLWLESQGRIAGPLVRQPGEDRSRPIGWDDALDPVADHLRALPSPDHAAFCTAGRTSSEAAGFQDHEAKLARPGGFLLPHRQRDHRRFATATGRARFTVKPPEYPRVPPGRLLLQTIRGHDQFNTTVHGLDDRYRGVRGDRHVVLAHVDDIAALGFAPGDAVHVVSEWSDGERRAAGFRLVAYPTARGCAAAYFPEANVLVPLGSRADVSRTPTSKSVVVRFERP